MAFEREYNFYSFDAYPDGLVKVSSIFRALQQLAREDMDNSGVTYPSMRKDNIVFVLIKLRLKLYKKLSIYDKYTVKTIPIEISGIYFIRDFFIKDSEGNIVGEATSSWVLINYVTRRPQRPSALKQTMPHCDEVRSSLSLSRTISCEQNINSTYRSVLLSDMDENNHLNNAVIVDYITDQFADEIIDGKYVSEIEVHFHKEAHYGTVLDIGKFHSDEDNKFAVCADFPETGDNAFLCEISLTNK